MLTKLLIATSPYHSLGQRDPKPSTSPVVNATGPHYGCLLALKDREPPHDPLVGEGYEHITTRNYKVENEAGSMAAQCINGYAAGYPCNNVNLLSMLPISDLDAAVGTSSMANDIWGWTDASTGREFALIGLYKGTAFVEITDPVNPIYLGGLPTQGSGSDWRDIKTFGNHAFIVSEESNHGMQIFDLTNLLTASPGTTFSNTARYTGISSAHNIFINEDTGFAYIVGANCNGGLHMVDISDATNPESAGCFTGDGYTHDVQCVIYNGPDSTYNGNEICFASNEDTITIVDVTNKGSPNLISKQSYQNDEYTHQGWLTEDHSHFVFNDEVDEYNNVVPKTTTHVMNVSDLNNMIYVGTYSGRTNAIDHNHYVMGEYLYQANYRAGFNVLKINDVTNLEFEEAGYFDIYPSSDSNNFNGAWSNYPYFPSGTIIVSGIEQGLFMLQFQEPSPTISPVPTTSPTTLSPTISPVPTTSPTSCDGVHFLLELLTDNFGSETSWTLTEQENGNQVLSGGAYTSNESFEVEECVAYGCYVFTMFDTYGDGMCCQYGDGFYSVTVDGEIVVVSNGNFDFFETTNFCESPPPPTCVDSGLLISHQGNEVTCAQVEANNACSIPVAASHCPVTCSKCDQYECVDSQAPWVYEGDKHDCDVVGNLDSSTTPTFAQACGIESVASTCRGTCGYCD